MERKLSKGLSDRLMGEKGLKSIKEFKKTEKDLTISVYSAIEYLRDKYKNIKFSLKKSYNLSNIVDPLKEEYPKYDFRNVNSTSKIRPDGGFIIAEINGKEHIIAISEMKYQKSITGNAFERAAKNISVCRDIMNGKKYFPYILFIQGKIIHAKNLIDRIVSMNYNIKENQIIVVEENYNIRPFTLIIKENIDISLETTTIINVCERSLAYLNKNIIK